jgi:hypothetical protein
MKTANDGSFKNGGTPWNKGKKGWAASGTERTRFVKGQPGRNWKPVGSISIRADKNKTLRRFIKVSEPNVWQLYAIYIWGQVNGKVPAGKVLHHIDHDALHDELSNLVPLTRSEHLAVHRQPRLFKDEPPKPKQEALL